MDIKNRRPKFKILFLVTGCWLLVTLFGCEAFVRKFTRKPKNEDLTKEEMVLAPEEYTGPEMTREELYRHYFLYWKSWQDELIVSLQPGANHKKQMSCVNEAIKNLAKIKGLLAAEKTKQMDTYLAQMESLKDLIIRDVYSNNAANNRTKAEQLKRNILRDFSYSKVKNSLI
jgi:hypothetical protein